MTQMSLSTLTRRAHAALVWLVLAPVGLYRLALSPLKRAPSCRFLPTCSEYAVEAVRSRGIIVGGALALWRILRCQPLCRGGYDPVPHRGGCRGEEHA
jgi:putative membrane protein insertion efficiency factor